MDNSISKALIIVAGLLLAMIVIAFVTFSFRRVGMWATVKEDEVEVEQRDKFNKEYEAYDKPLMYGVDVISCLNKAKSNNDKLNGKYAEKVDKAYEVQVYLNIKKNLNDTVRVYHMDANTKKEIEYLDNNKPDKDLEKNMDVIFNVSPNYTNKTKDFNCIDLNKNLSPSNKITKISGQFKLTKDKDKTSPQITALLELSREVKQIRKNNSKTSSDPTSWTKAVWETPVYDLKTRRFKCTGIEYSTETGRVNKISFEEI